MVGRGEAHEVPTWVKNERAQNEARAGNSTSTGPEGPLGGKRVH